VADSNSNNIPDSLESNVNELNGLSTLPKSEVDSAMKSFKAQQAPTSVAAPQAQLEDLELQVLGSENAVDPNVDFDVIDTENRLAKVSGKDLKNVLSSGAAKLVSAEQKSQMENEEKYGNKNIQAGVLGAARGLSFGLSDQALVESGAYDSSELSGIEKANPYASVGGEITGAVVPALLSGGTSTVATGAKVAGSAIRASEVLGAKVAAKATASLVKSGVSQGAARQIALKMLPDIVDLGVQGAAQGIGRLTTENAFGEADFNAQNLVAYAGMGSLVGGTFGAALGMGKAAVPTLKSVAGKASDAIDSGINKVFSKEDAAVEMSGLSVNDIVKKQNLNPNYKSLLTDELDNVISAKKPKSYEQFYDAVPAVKAEAGEALSTIRKNADNFLKTYEAEISSPEQISSAVMRTVDEHISKLGNFTTKSEIEALQKQGSEFAENIIKNYKKDSLVQILQKDAELLQNKIKEAGFMAGPEVNTVTALRKDMLKAIRNEQFNIIKNAADISGNPAMLKEYRKNLQTYSVLSGIGKSTDKAAEKLTRGSIFKDLKDFGTIGAGAIGGAPGAAAFIGLKKSMQSFTAQKAIVMGKLQMSQMRLSASINRVANSIGEVGSKIATSADDAAFRHITSFVLSKNNGKKPENDQEAYQNIANNLNKYAMDPESALKHSNNSTAAIFEHAPKTAAQVDATYLLAMQYLNSKVKKSSKKKGAFDMNKSDSIPTLEISKMKRYMEAVEDPISVLKKASKGKISREGVDVLKNVYPKIYKELQIKSLESASKKGKKLSYQEKLNLGLLLGVNAHETTDYNNLMGLQNLISGNTAQASSEVKYSPARAANITKGPKMETVTQEKGLV
jgi:hypothetical protein